VNSKGEWQEEVAKALALFFNFEPIKYNHYRRFCGSELVLCPFVWLPLCTILIVAILMGWVHSGRGISLCILSILLLAALGAYPYRRWAVKKFREELSQKFKKGGPFPSLIAHSFGTYLSGRAMRDLSWASYDRMVLAGCVFGGRFFLGRERWGSYARGLCAHSTQPQTPAPRSLPNLNDACFGMRLLAAPHEDTA
jgi:hypothetical protein